MRKYFNIFKINYIKMSLGTTSISELPVSNSNSNSNSQDVPANIQLQTKDTNEVVNNTTNQLQEQRDKDDSLQLQQNKTPPNPQDYMKQVENDVSMAKAQGQLRLPERDIPRENTHITQDNTTRANYVPEGPDDYIQKYQTNQEVQEIHKKKENVERDMDFLYEELQTPILISLMYFLFQLPVVSKFLIRHMPKLFKTDGNLNTKGNFFYSILFGSCYYLFIKAINYIAE